MNIPGSSSSKTTLKDAEQLLEQGEMRAARELIENKLDADGNSADLLATLADVEFADGNVIAGRNRLADAAKASGRNAKITARQIRVLGRNGLWRDGLREVEKIPGGCAAIRGCEPKSVAFTGAAAARRTPPAATDHPMDCLAGSGLRAFGAGWSPGGRAHGSVAGPMSGRRRSCWPAYGGG